MRLAMEPLADEVVLRAATEADLRDIVRIKYQPPEPPLATLLGEERAARIGEILVFSGDEIPLLYATLALVGTSAAGLLVCGVDAAARPVASAFLPLLPRIIRILGPAAPRAVYGFWLRGKLAFDPVPGAFVVDELYVREDLRNRGIGGRLLHHADDLALRANAPRMTVETGITNPARRLYERHGYNAVAEKMSIAYQRVTGSPGRVLMVKDR
jgi:GNAT superfamily N-acetyltransferase